MTGNNPDLVFEMTDTINLQYQPGGFRIFKTRTMIGHIASEQADDGSLLIFGEYSFFLLLKSTIKKNDYSIKIIKCPFIKPLPVNETIKSLTSGNPEIGVSVQGMPECTLENMEARPSNECRLYKIHILFHIELQPPDTPEETNISVNDADVSYETRPEGSPADNSSVKVWRVEQDSNHTVEQLLGIDRDTLKHFSKNQKNN